MNVMHGAAGNSGVAATEVRGEGDIEHQAASADVGRKRKQAGRGRCSKPKSTATAAAGEETAVQCSACESRCIVHLRWSRCK